MERAKSLCSAALSWLLSVVLVAGLLPVCAPGRAWADDESTYEALTAGEEVTVAIDEAGEYVYCSFTPDEDGTYRFYTTGDLDTYVYLYDADGEQLFSAYGSNALIEQELTAGTYYVAFGLYDSSATGEFTAGVTLLTDISDAEVTLDADTYYCTGSQITPTPTVTLDGEALTEGTDYTVEYGTNLNLGTGYVYVYACGDYTGSVTLTFSIEVDTESLEALTAGQEVTVTISTAGAWAYYSFTPAEDGPYLFWTDTQTYRIYLYDADWVRIAYALGGADLEYELIADTTYYIVFRLSSSATGSFTAGVTLLTDISDAEVTLDADTYAYTGSQITPTPTVTLDGVELTEGTDYTVEYGTNFNVGTGYVYVYACGDYTGSVTLTFSIEVDTESLEALTAGQEVTATISTAKAYAYYSFTPDEDGLYRLWADEDYRTYVYLYDAGWEQLDYAYGYGAEVERELSAGTTYYVAFRLYSSSATGSFAAGVDAVTDISGATVTLDAYTYTYTGSAIEPAVTVTLGGETLEEGTDYTVEYDDNVVPDTGYVYVYGCGEYGGTATVEFAIEVDVTTLEALTAGQGVTVDITTAGAYAIYSFTPDEDGLYRLQAHGSTYVYLYDADWWQIAYASGYGAAVAQELSAGTTYYVAFRLYSSSATGSFTARVYLVEALTAGQEVTVDIDEAGEYAYYSFTPTEDGLYRFWTDEDYRTDVYMYDANWSQRGSSGGYGAEYEKELTAGTTYYVAFRLDSSTATGSFAAGVKAVTDISDAEATLDADVYYYSNSQIMPTPTVTLGGETLEEGTDYTVEYVTNLSTGTGYVYVYGCGDYTGSVTLTFAIEVEVTTLEALAVGQEVTVDIATAGFYAIYSFTPDEDGLYRFYTTGDYDTYAYLYDADWSQLAYDDDSGDDHNALIDQELTAGTTYYVAFRLYDLSAIGSFTAGVTLLTDISDATVLLDADEYAYTGSRIKPTPTVTLDGETLEEGTDYTVTYGYNLDIGTGYVYVYGCGDYTGAITYTFTIGETTVYHDWGEADFEWAEDYSSVTATSVCANDPDHVSYATASGDDIAVEVVEPTCTEAGSVTYSVALTVGEREQSASVAVELEATGHTAGDAVVENEVAATCTEDGSYDNVVYCTVCGEELSREAVTLEATGHDWGEATFEWAEDYSSVTATSVCANDSSHVSYAAASGDDITAVTVEADCTSDGSVTYSVALTVGEREQSASVTVAVPATGHTPGEAVVENEVAATCTAEGSYDSVVYCANCGEELSRETITVAMLDHVWTSEVTTEATCESEGVLTYTCGVGGETYTEAIEATGHSFTNYVSNGDATCDEDGTKTAECDNGCGATDTVADEGSALGHDYAAAVTEPTCTEAGHTTYTCSRCGDSYVADEVAATGHTAGEAVVEDEVAATATADGSYDSVVYCTVCGAEISRETVVVPATGYSYSFEDVTDESAWYYDSIYQVAEIGLMTGTSSTVFGRTGNLTRAQLAVVFWRIAEPEAAAAYDSTGYVSTTTTVSGIADGKYYTAAADWAVAEGVINGKEAADGSRYFDPTGTVTFQEFCAVLANYLDNDQAERDAIDADEALSGFSDAASVSSWAASSVAWCVSNGVVNGNDDGTLGPKTKIKRQRAAVMLANAVNVGALEV